MYKEKRREQASNSHNYVIWYTHWRDVPIKEWEEKVQYWACSTSTQTQESLEYEYKARSPVPLTSSNILDSCSGIPLGYSNPFYTFHRHLTFWKMKMNILRSYFRTILNINIIMVCNLLGVVFAFCVYMAFDIIQYHYLYNGTDFCCFPWYLFLKRLIDS